MVLFPYMAQNEDELSLQEGQLITIITKDCEDKGWWKGEIDGKVGVFPDNFVKRVSQNMSEEVKPVLPETPEKPKPVGLKSSPSKDNIKNLFETSNSSVISKATSFEKLKQSDSGKNDEDKVSRPSKMSELNKKVSNIKNELSKSDLFKSNNKPEAPKPKLSSSAGSRASLSSIISESDKQNIKDVKRRISGELLVTTCEKYFFKKIPCRTHQRRGPKRGGDNNQAITSHCYSCQGSQAETAVSTFPQGKCRL